MRKKKFTAPLFGVDWLCVVGTRKEYTARGGEDDGAFAVCLSGEDGIIAWFFEDNPSVGLIAHEAYHVAHAIAQHVGVSVVGEAEEVGAYLTEHAVTKIHEFTKQKTPKTDQGPAV